jgi:hypothetical protein
MSKNLDVSKFCTPAIVYFGISIVSIILMLLQNMSGNGTYKLGSYSCDCGNVGLVFLGKLIYVFLWTWILNFICRKGYKNISWFLVLFPFILFFVFIGMFLLGRIEKQLY